MTHLRRNLKRLVELELKFDVPLESAPGVFQSIRTSNVLGSYALAWTPALSLRDRYFDAVDFRWWIRRSYFRVRQIDGGVAEELTYRAIEALGPSLTVLEHSTVGSRLYRVILEVLRAWDEDVPLELLHADRDDAPWPELLRLARLAPIAEILIERQAAQVSGWQPHQCTLKLDHCECLGTRWCQVEVTCHDPGAFAWTREFARWLAEEAHGQFVPTSEMKLDRALAIDRGQTA